MPVAQRPLTGADRQGGAQSALHVALGLLDSVGQGQAAGAIGRDRRPQGAAAAMGVGGVDRGMGEPLARALAAQQVIAPPQRRQTAALDQHRSRAQLEQPRRRPLHIGWGLDGHTAEQPGLVKVGGEQLSQGHQQPVGRDRVGFQQHRPGARHHHRIDQPRQCQRRQGGGGGLDQRGFEQHAGLERPHRQIAGHRPDLGQQRRRRQRIDPADARGVLGRDAGDGTAAMHLQGHERFEVGLNAGAAAGIAAADGEGDGWGPWARGQFSSILTTKTLRIEPHEQNPNTFKEGKALGRSNHKQCTQPAHSSKPFPLHRNDKQDK